MPRLQFMLFWCKFVLQFTFMVISLFSHSNFSVDIKTMNFLYSISVTQTKDATRRTSKFLPSITCTTSISKYKTFLQASLAYTNVLHFESESISNSRTKISRAIKVIARHCSTFNAPGPTLLQQMPKTRVQKADRANCEAHAIRSPKYAARDSVFQRAP